jgi:lysozyme
MRDYSKVWQWQQLDGKPWTIGYGHAGTDVAPGMTWTESHAAAVLSSEAQHAVEQCDERIGFFHELNDARQGVLANMAFNMGIDGLLKFHDTLRCVGQQKYAEAAEHMGQSLWSRQTVTRATALIEQMTTGKWA